MPMCWPRQEVDAIGSNGRVGPRSFTLWRQRRVTWGHHAENIRNWYLEDPTKDVAGDFRQFLGAYDGSQTTRQAS
jgi:hypothetical protein